MARAWRSAWACVVLFLSRPVLSQTSAFFTLRVRVLWLLEQPWYAIYSLANFYETEVLDHLSEDFAVAGALTFALMKSYELDESFDAMYVAMVDDGSFLGYFNRQKRSDSYEMTLLPGWDCGWNYTKACNGSEPCSAGDPGSNPACREIVDVGGVDGFPDCETWKSMSCPYLELADLGLSCDDFRDCVANQSTATTVYDPRVRPWFKLSTYWFSQGWESTWSDIYTFASSGDLGITATHVYSRDGESPYATVSVDYVLTTLDELLGTTVPSYDVAYLVEESTSFLVAVSRGDRTASDGSRLAAVNSTSPEIRAAAEFALVTNQRRKRVIQRRFNVDVLEAIPKRKASTL